MPVYFYKKLTLIILLGLIARAIAIFIYADPYVDGEWGILLDNLLQNEILSVRSVDGVPVPNIFMPPLYPLFLYLVKLLITNLEIFLNVIFSIHLILAILSIIIVHKIFLEIFSPRISLIGTAVFALFPLNIYAVSQISSITLQIFLINIFLFSCIKLIKKMNYKNIFLFSISSAMLILLRGEFFIFVILTLIYLQLKHNQKIKILITALIIIITISPYLYRNYNIFGVITVTKSSGYNLLKGNNPRTVVEGIPMFLNVERVIPETKEKLNNLYIKGPIKKHDLFKDQILLDQAIEFIKMEPTRYTKLYVKKFLSFIFIDFNSTYPKYYSVLHLLPKIILSIFTIVGVILIFNLKMNIANYVTMFYFSNIGLFSFFFILPRYSLSLLTIQIILSLYGVEKILKKFNTNKNEKNN